MSNLTKEEMKSMSLLVSEKRVNGANSVFIHAVPITYDVCVNDDLIYSCNNLENARTLQSVLLCDLSGVVYKDGI